jgi:hypothetical protein
MTAHPESRSSGGRVAFTVWVAILSLLVGLMFIGVTVVTIGTWLADPSRGETNPVVDLCFFALGGVLIGAGLVIQLRAPERHVAGLQQGVIGLLALAVAGLLGDRVEPLWGGVILLGATSIAVGLHPARGALLRAGAGLSAPLATLALLAAIPAIQHAERMLELARQAGPSCFMGQCARGDRFAEMAAVAIATVLVALLASARTGGWRVSAWSAGVAAAILGMASIALPDVTGSVGWAWGALAAIWGVLVVSAAEWQMRRTETTTNDPGEDSDEDPSRRAGRARGRGTARVHRTRG